MKGKLIALAVLLNVVCNIFAQNNDTKLEVKLNNGQVHSVLLDSEPKATFNQNQMMLTTGTNEKAVDFNEITSIKYSSKGANLSIFQDQYSNVSLDFDQIYPNRMTFAGKPAIRIEAEDLDNLVESKSANIEVVTPLPKYADRVSGGKLLHVTSTTKIANPSLIYGNLHVTGSYNIYLVAVPGTYVNENDDINRTRKVRLSCMYQSFNGKSYSSKTTSFSYNPDNSSEKLMIDYSDIDTLLLARSYTSPSISLDETHKGTFTIQSQRLSADDTVNDFYFDCLILVPSDSEGNDMTECNTLVVEKDNFRSFISTESLQYIQWQKEKIITDDEVKVPYGKTAKINYSFSPDFITYPSIVMESEDENIASVDAKGIVTGNSVGSTYIILTDIVGGATTRCKVTVTGTPATANTLIVNEVMSANLDQIIDPSYNYGGWVELYNPTDDDLIIARCYVSDDPDNLTKFHLSSKAGSVPAHSYRNIWFDHSDYTADQVPFKLDCDGGTIYFSDTNGNLITSFEYPEAKPRCSYARKTDGAEEWGWTAYPTPEGSNATSIFATEQLSDPEVSIQSCLYNGDITFHVTVPDGAKLLYTLNGSVPTESNSMISTDGDFTYSNTVAIRFRAFKDGYLPSNVVTRSFIQADGFDAIGIDIREIPILSIVTDRDNLFSNQLGIFVQGTNGRPGNGHSSKYNTNMDWDRPVDFQYLQNGEYAFSQEADIATCGGWSRTFGYHSSFKIKADKKYYGLKTLDYPFFDQKPYLKNKTLQIRNGGNDSSARIKDAYLQSVIMSSDLNIDCQSYQPTLHFINGSNYGIINMREPNNKHFVYANYGWNSDEIDMFEMSPDSAYCQQCGTKDAFNEWYELSKNAADPVTYSEICRLVDIDEYINYLAVELYTCNWDWPQNNLKGFRHRDGGKFRFVVYDLDGALQGMSNPFSTFSGKKNYTFDTCYPDMTKLTTEIEFVTIFENMLQNDEFRKRFIDTFCLIGATIFEPNRVEAIGYELLDRVGLIQYAIEGYDKSPYNTAYNVMNAFYEGSSASSSKQTQSLASTSKFQLKNAKKQYCEINYYLQQGNDVAEMTAPILYNGIKMPTQYFIGYLFPPVTLTAEPLAGKKFEGWFDTTAGKLISAEAEYELAEDVSRIVAVYSDLPQTDKEAQNITPVRINEVSAANTVYANDYNKREDWVEFYNTTSEPYDIEGMYITDNPDKPEKYQIKADGTESTIIPPYGHKVMWFDKKTAISQLHAPFKLDNDGDILILTSKDHTWSDTFEYTAHEGNQTVGRYPDGTDNIFLMNTPTIEKTNISTSYITPVHNGQLDPSVIESLNKSKAIQLAYSNSHLHIESNEAVTATISIISMDGKLVMSTEASLLHGSNTISLQNLPAGTYLAHVKTGNKVQGMVKFAK